MYNKSEFIGLIAPVLDQGFVELVDFMGDDNAMVDAARVSFNKSAENYTEEQNLRLQSYLLEHGHTSPAEMISFKFRVNAPVVVWWHWVRHRMASYNFVSGRYVAFQEKAVYVPQPGEWRLQSKSNKQGSEGYTSEETGQLLTLELVKHYDRCFYLYERALGAGVAREQARLFLPGFAVYYPAIVQMNARSLMNFLTLREDNHAQFEIQEYARVIRSIVSRTHPRLFGTK